MAVSERQPSLKPLVIISTIALFLASWLVANVDIGESVTWVSAFFILILAVPSYYVLLRWLSPVRGLLVLIFLSIFPILVEAIGITTGLPYGGFQYTDQMGYKILGLVPWSVAFAFGPLVIGAVTVAAARTRDPRIALPLGAILLVVFDLILDPAAVVLNIWVWDEPGLYYGIPLTNYTGWLLTGLVASLILHALTSVGYEKMAEYPKELSISLLLTISFWTGYSLWTVLIVPTIIGATMLSYLLIYLLGD
ncbi:MAG: carotenoid biosynthesis protein [Candidatus Thorarchaeota archaeon]|nr:MAG: carotenoid biosynthesis protein [Candidatus Thorarchaeota archaeon]